MTVAELRKAREVLLAKDVKPKDGFFYIEPTGVYYINQEGERELVQGFKVK